MEEGHKVFLATWHHWSDRDNDDEHRMWDWFSSFDTLSYTSFHHLILFWCWFSSWNTLYIWDWPSPKRIECLVVLDLPKGISLSSYWNDIDNIDWVGFGGALKCTKRGQKIILVFSTKPPQKKDISWQRRWRCWSVVRKMMIIQYWKYLPLALIPNFSPSCWSRLSAYLEFNNVMVLTPKTSKRGKRSMPKQTVWHKCASILWTLKGPFNLLFNGLVTWPSYEVRVTKIDCWSDVDLKKYFR